MGVCSVLFLDPFRILFFQDESDLWENTIKSSVGNAFGKDLSQLVLFGTKEREEERLMLDKLGNLRNIHCHKVATK